MVGAKGVNNVKAGVYLPGVVFVLVPGAIDERHAVRLFLAVYKRFVHFEPYPAEKPVYAAFYLGHAVFYKIVYKVFFDLKRRFFLCQRSGFFIKFRYTRHACFDYGA